MQIIVIDCFKLIKGKGKSIGIYNLALNLVCNLVKEQESTSLNKMELYVIGNTFNKEDFNMKGVTFIETKYNPESKIMCVLWELFFVSFFGKKLGADKILYPRGFAPLFNIVKSIIIVHDFIPFYYHKHYYGFFHPLENAYIMWRLKASVKKANQVITISQESKNDIIKQTKVDPSKIKIIYNGVNKLFDLIKEETNPYIIAITSTLPHKNAKAIVASYVSYYKQNNNPIPLKIIGIKDVEQYELEEEIKNNITCYAFIKGNKELQQMIKNASCFLFLSLKEGFGFPPLEAMQQGIPVVCSNRSSLPEVVGNAALLVDPDKSEEVAKAIQQLLGDKELQNKLIKLGYENVSRFCWEDIAKEYYLYLLNEENLKKFKYCSIFKTNILVTSMEETIEFIKTNLQNIKGEYICFSNVHTIVLSNEDTNYNKIQNDAFMALPDGRPLSILSRMYGFKEAKKVSGPDFMGEIFSISAGHGYKHFFYGSTEETLNELKIKLESLYPGIQIVGMVSPPFRAITDQELECYRKEINDANADFLWVGLGAPKQEIWMAEQKGKIDALMLGVGAGFDFHAGTVKRAPKWMQKVGLEWFYRLIDDPKRLWKRYLVTNTKFLFLILKDIFKLNGGK